MLSASDRWPRLATSDFQILIWMGLTQLRSSASQHHAFCLRQHGTYRSSVCGFSARSAEKPHTIGRERTALPKAQHANRVSPITYQASSITDHVSRPHTASTRMPCAVSAPTNSGDVPLSVTSVRIALSGATKAAETRPHLL